MYIGVKKIGGTCLFSNYSGSIGANII